jgi:hypothetical protein
VDVWDTGSDVMGDLSLSVPEVREGSDDDSNEVEGT